MRSGAPGAVRVELLGGDAYGRGDRPVLSWWLPAGAARQTGYRIRTGDGDDTGPVESDRQSFVEIPGPDLASRQTLVCVQVWTDLGESAFSRPVPLPAGPLEVGDWTGSWIGVAEPRRPSKGSRPAYWLRRVVEVPPFTRARVQVTALGLYELYVDGTRVGDDELAPGFTQYRQRVPYQSHDVSALVRPGRTVLAALLADGWYRGQVGMPRAADQFGTDLALRLQLQTIQEGRWATAAGTDERWRTARSHVTAADLIGGQREDHRLLEPIHDPGFDDRTWAPAVARDVDVAIVRPVAPPVRRVQELRPVRVERLDPGATGSAGTGSAGTGSAGTGSAGTGAFIVDLGQNINGWARLSDLGPAGTEITIRHGEHLDAGGDLTTTHLDVDVPILPERLPVGQVDAVVSAGVPGDVFEPRLTTHGFRYLRIEGHPGPLAPDDVTGVVVHSDLRRTGWFSCSDERVNALHEAVVWSLRANVCAIPTDCPQRERAGWTGDWQVFAGAAAFLYDVLGFTRSWLRDAALEQRADGCVAGLAPCPPDEGFEGPLARLNGSAGWGDVVVSAPWDLYQAYGDLSLLRESWTSARGWVDFAAGRAATGRHPARAAARPTPAPHERFLWDTGFHWGEWLEPGVDLGDFAAFAAADKSEVATAYLARSAATLAGIGQLLGADPAVVAGYRDLAQGARAAWVAEFVDGEGCLRVQSQASHVRALAFGLLPQELRPAAADRLVDLVALAGGHLTTGFLGTGLLLPTLAEAGRLDTAYQLLMQDTEPSWLTMIDRGATTMWEHWNGVDDAGLARGSLNHYSKGAVVGFLHRYVAGLAPTSPGYRSFRVAPRPGGGLTWARTCLDSPHGRIEVSWRLGDGQLLLDLLVPGGASAEVVLPDGRTARAGPGRHAWSSAVG